MDNANPTLIDNIFSNCVDCNITCGNLIEKISDHLPNFLIIPNYKNSELKNKYYKRDYSQFNEDLYLRNFLNDDILGSLINSDDTSNKYDRFHEHLITTLNRHAPLKARIKNDVTIKNKPWLIKGILKSISIRTMYYNKFMNTKDSKWYTQYKIYRDKINHIVRKSKNNYYKTTLKLTE